MYEMYSDGYDKAVDVPKEVFDRVDLSLCIKGSNSKVKYLLGNETEEDHLESLDINVDRMSDYFAVKLIDERILKVGLNKELILQEIPKTEKDLLQCSSRSLRNYVLWLNTLVATPDSILTVEARNINSAGTLRFPEYGTRLRKTFYTIIGET